MAWKPPKVSIGLPVRNAQAHLAATLDSILSQSFEDFELIICDNASSDSTATVCVEYASRDPRIRYVRHQRVLGPAELHNSAVELACGQYFRWHEQNDTMAPEYLARCVKVLDDDTSVVVVYPQTTSFDANGVHLGADDHHLKLDGATAWRRFRRLILAQKRDHANFEIYGLMRWAALRETPLQEAYAGADCVLMARLALLGRLRHIRRPLFTSRTHAAIAAQVKPTRIERRSVVNRYLGCGPMPPPQWWNPSLAGRIVFPNWNLLRQYWRSVNDAPLNMWQQSLCKLAVIEWAARNTPRLVRDIAFAGETIASRITSRWRRLRKRAALLLRSRSTSSPGAELKLS